MTENSKAGPTPPPAEDAKTDRHIYALTDIPPETQAYALARYSRSAASLRESVAWIGTQKAADFLETFYFSYGHKSIADMAHLTLALENISVLAAISIEDEQLWDGQERSTRYQDFSRSRYVVPPELDAETAPSPASVRYTEAADRLFSTYTALTKELLAVLVEVVPRPEAMEPAAYKRTLQARVLDVTRTLLPYATRTSVGQVTSARVLERQLARLLASPYAEIRQIAAEMKEACRQPAFSPLAVRMAAALETALAQQPDAALALHSLAEVVAPTHPAPTLVKYVTPSSQASETAQALSGVVREYLGSLEPDTSYTVRLAESDPPMLEAVASLLYRYSDLAYWQVQSVVRDMPPAVRQEIYDLSQATRGRHDPWLREQQAGYGRIYDLLIDAKALQDFFRHRRCVQVRQDITARHGFVAGSEWFGLGLPRRAAEVAEAAGLTERYDTALRQAAREVAALAGDGATAAAGDYLLPLGYRRRALFKMDDAQAAYIIETRSGVNGHYAYRQAAHGMWQALHEVEPGLAKWIRLTPFDPQFNEAHYLDR